MNIRAWRGTWFSNSDPQFSSSLPTLFYWNIRISNLNGTSKHWCPHLTQLWQIRVSQGMAWRWMFSLNVIRLLYHTKSMSPCWSHTWAALAPCRLSSSSWFWITMSLPSTVVQFAMLTFHSGQPSSPKVSLRYTEGWMAAPQRIYLCPCIMNLTLCWFAFYCCDKHHVQNQFRE